MRKVNKKVSIVIPVYNPLRTLEKCLESIKNQSYQNIEILVVDSKDYDKKIRDRVKMLVNKYGKYYVDGPERSIQRNRGIKEATGEYILTIDQDMYLTKNVILECVNKIEKNYIALKIPEISVGEGFWTKCVALERYVNGYLEDALNECCRFFKKKDGLLIGGYDPEIVGVEDSDFHYRMADRGKMGKIKSHIIHDEGKTSYWNRIKKKYYYSKAFRKYLSRRPGIAVKQFSPIKKAYFKHWQLFIKQPLVTLGVIALRSGEVFAGALGILIKNNET